MNNVVLIGRLTKDPELRYTTSGSAVTRFTLAVDKQLSNEKKSEFEAKGQPTADFIRIVVWGRQAENCANYLAKGRLVAVNGRIETGSYQDKDGKMVYTTDVVAFQVQFLEWGDENQQSGGYQQGGNYQQQAPKQSFDNNSQEDSSSDFAGLDGFDSIDDEHIPF